MKNVIIRFLKILILMLFIINILNTTIYASPFGEVISGAEDFLNSAESKTSIDQDELKSTSDTIYNILLMLSFGVVAIIGIIIGIKFMMGTAEQKAEQKKALWPFFIGTIVVYGSFAIWKVLVSFLNDI